MTEETTTILWAAPILPGKEESWRRFCQELMASRRAEYDAAHRRLGVCRQEAWLVKTAHHDLAVVHMRLVVPDEERPGGRQRVWRRLWQKIQDSERPFDRWYRKQLEQICGPDLVPSLAQKPSERLFRWPGLSEGVAESVTDQPFTRRKE